MPSCELACSGLGARPHSIEEAGPIAISSESTNIQPFASHVHMAETSMRQPLTPPQDPRIFFDMTKLNQLTPVATIQTCGLLLGCDADLDRTLLVPRFPDDVKAALTNHTSMFLHNGETHRSSSEVCPGFRI